MTSYLALMAADFTTQLSTALSIGGTSASILSQADADGVNLPDGRYCFTLDYQNSYKEHITCTKTGTALTSIKSLSRQGVETSGVVRPHRIGATVIITDWAHILFHNNLLNGTTSFDASTPLGYDGTASITTANQFATKAYVDGVAVSGAPNATTSVKGIVELATQAEYDARTATGSTGASLVITPDINRNVLTHDYAADAGSTDAYAITLTPAITAYTTGDIYYFKANTVNTGACTLNVNAVGAKALKYGGSDPYTGMIAAGSYVQCQYDGTNMNIQWVSSSPKVSQGGLEIYGADSVGTDAYAITPSPAITAYAAGQVFRVKLGTANTGACTLAVSGLSALPITKNYNTALSTGDLLANQIIEVAYDAVNTSWQLLSPVSQIIQFKCGTTTKNVSDASATQTIAHGLGTTPKFVRILAMYSATATSGIDPGMFQATTVYNGTTQSSLSVYKTSATTSTSSANFLISAAAAGGSDNSQGVVTFDATNISIAWTKTGSPGSAVFNLLWEAQG